MNLKEIMSVSGQSGLFRFISQGRNGIIVESFADKKRSFVSVSSKVSSLEDIAIFTTEGEVPLKQVFRNINERNEGAPAPEPKSSPEDLRAFMEKVMPEYDRDRVYVSDIRKLANWYNTLVSMELLDFSAETEAVETEAAVNVNTSEPETAIATSNEANGGETEEKAPVRKTKTAKPAKAVK